MVDYEIRATSPQQPGVQQCSRRAAGAPATSRLRSQQKASSSDERGRAGALLLAHGPSMTSYGDGSSPSQEQHNKSNEATSSPDADNGAQRRGGGELSGRRSRQTSRPRTTKGEIEEHLQQAVRTLKQETQQREQERQGRMLELVPRAQHVPQEAGDRYFSAAESARLESSREESLTAVSLKRTALERPGDGKSPREEAKSNRKQAAWQALIFTGKDPAAWISVMESEFERRRISEDEHLHMQTKMWWRSAQNEQGTGGAHQHFANGVQVEPLQKLQRNGALFQQVCKLTGVKGLLDTKWYECVVGKVA
ncbi:hypothetical protein Efla_001332 [Eimeria flavescens]